MVYFWACEVTDTKAAVVKVPEGFVLNVCNATLGQAAIADVSLGLETKQMDDSLWKGVVCHLGKDHARQVKLDLVFGLVGQIKFYVASGSGKVNLTGYFQPGPPSDMMLDEESIPAVVVASNDSKKGKKRDREQSKTSVTWDQNASSDSDEEETPAKKPAVASTPSKQPKEEKKPAAASAASTPAEGASKKKRKNKNKKKAAGETKQ